MLLTCLWFLFYVTFTCGLFVRGVYWYVSFGLNLIAVAVLALLFSSIRCSFTCWCFVVWCFLCVVWVLDFCVV